MPEGDHAYVTGVTAVCIHDTWVTGVSPSQQQAEYTLIMSTQSR